MKRLPLFIIMICATNAIAQVSGISVHIGSNFPIIPSITQEARLIAPLPSSGHTTIYPNTGNVVHSFKGKAGIYASGNFEVKLNGRWFAYSGLTFNYTRFERTAKIERITNIEQNPATGYGTSYGNIIIRDNNGELTKGDGTFLMSPNGSTTLLGLQMPIAAGRTFFNDKLSVNAGAFLSYLINATIYKHNVSYVNTASGYQLQFNEYKDNTTKGFESLGAGLVFNASFLITSNITIDLSAQKSLSNIYDGDGYSTTNAKLNSLILGVGYRFHR